MTSAQIIIVVTIVLYLAAMVLVGVYFGKKGSGSSSDDFYLGGRKMGPVVTAMSAEASDMSSYLLMGLPGLAYLCGLPEVTWTAIGLAIGTYLNWLIVARRLRRYSAKLGAITIPDFFARRFGDKKHLLSCIAAVIIGGLSVAGGKGNIIGTLLGMLFFSILANGMGLLSMNSYAQQLVKGLLLLTAVYIDIVRNKKMKK